jgi:hypothetical protein
MTSLEGWGFTTKLHPPTIRKVLSARFAISRLVGRSGFEPLKRIATDLQSVPFGHLGTCPQLPLKFKPLQTKKLCLDPAGGATFTPPRGARDS